MKVLFTADIHIKLGQKNVPVEWAKNRYDKLFRAICDLAAKETVDLLVIGGDIFDKLPNMAELELFFDFMMRIRCDTVIYSGNHEADKKNTTFLSNLKDIVYQISCATTENNRIHIIDYFKHIDGIDFIPYNTLKDWAKDPTLFKGKNRILCTHVRGDIPPHVKAEVPLELFDRWDLVLAGDLHSYENSQRNILYPGSPVTTSFHRNRVDTGVLIVDTDTLQHEFVKLDLPQLIRQTIKAGDEMPGGVYDHIIYEVEGNLSELADMQGSELLDKKIVRRASDSALILDPSMSIVQEVEEYLRYILMLDGPGLDSILKELTTYVTE